MRIGDGAAAEGEEEEGGARGGRAVFTGEVPPSLPAPPPGLFAAAIARDAADAAAKKSAAGLPRDAMRGGRRAFTTNKGLRTGRSRVTRAKMEVAVRSSCCSRRARPRRVAAKAGNAAATAPGAKQKVEKGPETRSGPRGVRARAERDEGECVRAKGVLAPSFAIAHSPHPQKQQPLLSSALAFNSHRLRPSDPRPP